jgi:DNA-binding transcriptional LysR family regulator
MVFVGHAALFDERKYSLRELAKEGLITFQPGAQPTEQLLDLLYLERIRANRIDMVSSLSAMVQLVENKRGVAVMPRDVVVRAANPKLRVLKCKRGLPPLPFWLSYVQKGGANPIVDQLKESLLQYVQAKR